MAEKSKPDEGVALNISEPSNRFPDGVPVSVPEDASAPESKSGQKAAKEKN